MREVQRHVDRARGVGKRADGNVVNAGSRNSPDSFERNAAACLELYLALSGRDRFAHFRRLHVVEENDVDPFDLEERADLLEAFRLHFDPDSRTLLAEALDGAHESRET